MSGRPFTLPRQRVRVHLKRVNVCYLARHDAQSRHQGSQLASLLTFHDLVQIPATRRGAKLSISQIDARRRGQQGQDESDRRACQRLLPICPRNKGRRSVCILHGRARGCTASALSFVGSIRVCHSLLSGTSGSGVSIWQR